MIESKTHSPLAQKKMPPGMPGHPLLGVLPAFRRDPLDLFLTAAREYGDVVYMPFGLSRVYFIAHPDDIQYVLQINNRNYRREARGNEVLQIISGLNLLTSDGDYWLRQRRLMQPAFHRQRIAAFGELMTTAAERMLDRWRAPAASGVPLDISVEMMRVTLEIVGRALFRVDLSDETSFLAQGFTEGMKYFNYRLNHLLYWPLFVPTPRNRRFRQSQKRLHEHLMEIINQRRRSGADEGDLLSMLLQARYEDTGEGMTDEQLLNEVGVMIGAGHETTANALSWTFYLLSEHPEVEARMHAELDTVLQGRLPGVEDLATLPYTRWVIEESMRLYPPAWGLAGRQAVAEDEIGGFTVPPNTTILIVPFVTHRDPRFWDEPERFNPERFDPERSEGRPRYAYLPFGGGPRLCIGSAFAMTEAQLLLATIAQRYCLRLQPGHPVVPYPIFTLRIRDGLPMFLETRG